MTETKLKKILAEHELWLRSDGRKGSKADLFAANLACTDLLGISLEAASLTAANLSGTNLRYSNLKGADLNYAGLRGTDLDFSCWPLWCGSLRAYVDDRIAIQLLYHTLSVVQHSPYVSEEIKKTLLTKPNLDIANRFHRANECGELKGE